ncbi:MAG: hypothetical protein MUP41_04960, partial [Desulfobacterales bacterium]|nr:hypothetical protein [Desulfobacterales bacterium]
NLISGINDVFALTHNGCYPKKGPKRRSDYESTVNKRIYRRYLLAIVLRNAMEKKLKMILNPSNSSPSRQRSLQ